MDLLMLVCSFDSIFRIPSYPVTKIAKKKGKEKKKTDGFVQNSAGWPAREEG